MRLVALWLVHWFLFVVSTSAAAFVVNSWTFPLWTLVVCVALASREAQTQARETGLWLTGLATIAAACVTESFFTHAHSLYLFAEHAAVFVVWRLFAAGMSERRAASSLMVLVAAWLLQVVHVWARVVFWNAPAPDSAVYTQAGVAAATTALLCAALLPQLVRYVSGGQWSVRRSGAWSA